MQTASYFDFAASKKPNAVGISRFAPKSFAGKVCLELAPFSWMLKLNEADFLQAYQERILAQLTPRDAIELVGENSILCCWEPFNVRCHRRLVAEWIESASGLLIPEFGKERADSIPFAEQKRAPKKEKPVKVKAPKPVKEAKPAKKVKESGIDIQTLLF